MISAGVRIWYRFKMPPSWSTVVFPANAGPREEGGEESNSDGACRAEMWEGEPVNMTRCLGKRDAIISSSFDRVASYSAIVSFLCEETPSRCGIFIHTTCLELDTIASPPRPGAKLTSLDPQRLEMDSAMFGKDLAAP